MNKEKMSRIMSEFISGAVQEMIFEFCERYSDQFENEGHAAENLVKNLFNHTGLIIVTEEGDDALTEMAAQIIINSQTIEARMTDKEDQH